MLIASVQFALLVLGFVVASEDERVYMGLNMCLVVRGLVAELGPGEGRGVHRQGHSQGRL